MNYIARLQTENAALTAQLAAMQAEVLAFHAHLASAKFDGVDLDGSRRDWIATRDVATRLVAIAEAGR